MKSKFLWCEREQKDGGRVDYRLTYWPITSSLDHTVLSSRLHFGLLLLGREAQDRRPTMGCSVGRCPSRAPGHSLVLSWLQAETDWILTLTDGHMGIYVYPFITLTHFLSTTWLLPLIFTGASWSENLWLTARSRVNLWHNGLIHFLLNPQHCHWLTPPKKLMYRGTVQLVSHYST